MHSFSKVTLFFVLIRANEDQISNTFFGDAQVKSHAFVGDTQVKSHTFVEDAEVEYFFLIELLTMWGKFIQRVCLTRVSAGTILQKKKVIMSKKILFK